MAAECIDIEEEISSNPTTAIVDLKALGNNVQIFKAMLPQTCKMMCVVKGNGYGHGLVSTSRAALEAGGDRLGVATLQEALELCHDGIQAPIHILLPSIPEEAEYIVEYDNIIPTVCTPELASALNVAALRKNKKVQIHLKVDTGMNRLGIQVADLKQFLLHLSALSNVELEGLFTHYSTAHAVDPENTIAQFSLFQTAMRITREMGFIPIFHVANTSATQRFPAMHLDMVRVGLGIFGVQPCLAVEKPEGLSPVMSLVSRVVQVKDVSAGSAVGYDKTYIAGHDSRIAVVSAGYVDGVERSLANRGKLLIRGKYVPIIGSVSMDSCVVDVTEIPNVQVGDRVVIIGNQGSSTLSVEQRAAEFGLSINEQWLHIGPRVQRSYI